MQKLMRRREVDMTVGSEFRHILTFALPLLLGNLFQQLYNMVDTWVVGNYATTEAFAAVGNVGSIINMLIGLFMGLASGAGVVISQYFGAKDHDSVRRAVHTAIALTAVLSVALSLIGVAMTPLMLAFMKIPKDVYADAADYLTIYFGGMIGLLFYNMGAGILRAVGDSQRPFYFLVVSALLNIGLDLLFVISFGWGVKGVALATVISQCVSAILTVATLMRSASDIRLMPRQVRFDGDMLKKIVRVGIPAALQMAVTAFSNVFVQSYINHFEAKCMSGWTAYTKIDALIFLPMQSLGLAATTFVGQNLGVGQVARARRGADKALMTAVTATLVISAAVIALAPTLVGFFTQDPEVLPYGVDFLHWLTPFYVLCCVNQVYSGALRGAGNSRAPMIIMLCSFVVFRQIYLYVMANYIANEYIPIGLGYPAGWLMCSLTTFIYYRRADIGKTRLTTA